MDELKHDDVGNRVEAMNKVDIIAIALGPERTLNELLPFLNDVAQDDEEEVFAILATKLGDFLPLIGGPKNVEPLMQILVHLLPIEEPIVRDKVIFSINNICKSLPDDESIKIILPIIQRLSQGTWFSEKIASCGLYKTIITKVPSNVRTNLLSLYLKLIVDDGPMVRRGAANKLPEIINRLTEHTINLPKSDPNQISNKDWEIISSMFQHLINDDQDSVKFLSIDVLISILDYFQKIHDNSYNSDFLLNSLKLISDESWRVRYTAAEKFNQIAINFVDEEQDLLKLVDPFISLMKDNEGEVRRAVAKNLPDFCKILNNFNDLKPLIVKQILPLINELCQDPQESVRSSLALKVTELSSILPEKIVNDQLLPVFLIMLKDEFPDVRLNVISSLSIVNETVGINLLAENLLPAVTELAQDPKWRVRFAIIGYIPKLAEQLGQEFFDERLLSLCLNWLWDPVYAIREASVENLTKITEIFGSKWCENHIIHKIISIKNHSKKLNDNDDTIHDDSIHEDNDDNIDFNSFIIRITCLFTVNHLIPVLDSEVLIEQLLPFLKDLIKDPVPNIRFNVAKSLKTVAITLLERDTTSKGLIENDISERLLELASDDDVDVKYFALKAIEEVKQGR